MSFSTGQLIFALAFILVFGVMTAMFYIQDQKKQKKYFKGAGFLLLVLIAGFAAFRFTLSML